MSPIRPRKRTLTRRKATYLRQSGSTSNSIKPIAHTNKRDKRKKKRTEFLSRILKPNQTTPKCRRPSKKLVTTLNSLLDALPNSEELVSCKGLNNNEVNVKSLKSQPGVMKRMAKLERYEKIRFDQNLAHIIRVGQGLSITDKQISTGDDVASNPKTKPEQQRTAPVASFAAIRAWANNNLQMHPGIKRSF